MVQEMETSLFHKTKHGSIYHGDSLDYFRACKSESVDLILTSPPFGLVRKKDYGNVDADKYVDWFRPFGEAFKRVLKQNGSLVIDIGGSWIPGQPSRSLYHYELLIMLCREFGFNLAQEFFWWNPSQDTLVQLDSGGRDARGPFYKIYHPGALWDDNGNEAPLPEDGGKRRVVARRKGAQ